ncbi:sensor histidine kinase [Azohydromonas caseinilytica]|uniref:histidine kinase n=1 Tax=Azohydromonas caseinilytica TaxID=2728836 RepID=A0A848FMB9_9BURK|nr:ATP-binding protein [Azohydromonas caseinilytica]NML18911.1 HAMP domain-containing protein [Azohydromonas caseinilytica]
MFTKKLQRALAILGGAALLQGAVAWWAINVATDHVHRGRVASDVLQGFLELSATKQRLRAWLLQALVRGDADVQVRDGLLADMVGTLTRLQGMAARASDLEAGDADMAKEHRERQEALAVLERSVGELRVAMAGVDVSPGQADAMAAWGQLSRVFDMSQGRDLRTLLAENIARERLAVEHRRSAADRSLALVRGVALGATLMLASAAAVLALYLARALRRPLQELRGGAEALQRGELGHRIPAQRQDEFGDVARTMNDMAMALEKHQQREAEVRHSLEELVQLRTAELQQALHVVEVMDARRRQLFADISHELRTPTTAIRGEAEITLRGRDKPVDEYKTALLRIADASRHLGSVIDDLLTIARNDIDTLSLHREPLLIDSVLGEALVQARALGREHEVSIELQPAPPGEPPMIVAGDAQRLRQAFMVVLDNAVRYSHPQGRVRVAAGAMPQAQGALRWQLLVQDEGIGIPPQDLPRVFERRFRSERARQHRRDGSGLGMNIAQVLVRAHGGEISVDSADAGGTRVCIRLPASPQASNPAAAAQEMA